MRNIDRSEADQLIADERTFILDVRTPKEFKRTSLDRAKLIPVDELAQRLDELPKVKSEPILIYCAHGVRSVHGGQLLEKMGYTNLLNLRGGLAAYLGREP